MTEKKSIQPSRPHTWGIIIQAETFLDEMIINYIWKMGPHVCLEDKKWGVDPLESSLRKFQVMHI
jgi:hypothetical protein